MSHRFQLFRAGGVDQVSVRDRDDLLALKDLDQKLWLALAMPTTGVDVDPDTLKLLDHDGDGRIRVHDILAAIEWANATLHDVGDVVTSSDCVALSAIADPKVLAAANRMLGDLGTPSATSISVADTMAITKAFADTVLNGDGVVVAESTDDPALRRTIEDIIAHAGHTTDRSGKPGVDKPLADRWFAGVDQRSAWLWDGRSPELFAVGPATAAAVDALLAVRGKIEDFFVRCQIAAFDPRGAGALAGQDAELVALASRELTTADAELARLPLARIDATARLSLGGAINPAWSARIAAFVDATVVPVLGPRGQLTAADFAVIKSALAPYETWRAAQPVTPADALEVDWLQRLARPELRAQLDALIADDAALAEQYDQISAVAKLVRMQRDFGRLLRNFVNFSDFYSKQDGVFQAGTLYLDARAFHLCVAVADPAKHAALAAASDACLVYCDLTRQGVTRPIVAALTNGDTDHVFAGRNGIFYDREGRDWDATIAKVVTAPVSIRQAFWAPYKRLVKAIEDFVNKRAAAADAAAQAKRTAAPIADKPEPAPKTIDLGTVAALGVAIGGIGTLFGVVIGTLFGLGVWIPLGVFGLLMMISGPAMVLAWLKLRRRNLGPILDANGWAINGRARINVAFGAAMTELAASPPGATRSIEDPYADKLRPWKLYAALAIVIVLAGAWWIGKLDVWLPRTVQSTTVRGL